MRIHAMFVAGLLVLLVTSAVRSRARHAAVAIDPAIGIGATGAVPEPVLSMLRRACFDCHSEETVWPWYSSLPGVSWLIEGDVNAGRGQLNFSRWAHYNPYDRADLLDKVCREASARRMPLTPYRLLHAEARLSDAELAQLCEWTRREAARLEQGAP
jgi:hypothetical protein